mgnify:CR=1 FL=1
MRVVSGIQPTGNPHLGNYLGAIKRWAEMQHETECLIFLADLHAITVYNDPAHLAATIREARSSTLVAVSGTYASPATRPPSAACWSAMMSTATRGNT